MLKVDNSAAGAVYLGLAIATTGGNSYLYAANFAQGKIDVFDGEYRAVTLAGNFTDPSLPANYAPFNIQQVGGNLYVAYALRGANGREVPGLGNGIVNVFDANGNFLRQLASQGPLNAPWGITQAPEGFAQYSGALLVGNFGDGRINAFNPNTGAWLGTLSNTNDQAIAIEGLWDLKFGNGGRGGDAHRLYFTAGIGGGGPIEEHGLFGSLSAQPVVQALVPPTLTTLLQSQVVPLGSNVTFSIIATGTAPLSYQWFKDGLPLDDQTGSSLVLAGAQEEDSGSYSVQVTNSLGTASSPSARLTVGSAPSFYMQPSSQTVSTDARVVLAAAATGLEPLFYQWKKNGTILPGQVRPSLILSRASTNDIGSYTVDVRNALGTITSASAELLVVNSGVFVAVNDSFASRVTITNLQATIGGSNLKATAEPNEPLHAGKPGGKSLWWSWTAAQAGSVTVDTLESDFDTLLAVYTGTSVSALTLVGSNDDANAMLGSVVTFQAAANQTYLIAVDGFNGASGNVVLRFNRPSVARLSAPSLQPDQRVLLTVQGIPGAAYRLQSSANLIEWDEVAELIAATPTVQVVVPTTDQDSLRFYRVIPVPVEK